MGQETKEDIEELEYLKEELEKDPNNVSLLLKIGMFLFSPFKDIDQALPYFEKAMELDPSNPDSPFWTGYALYYSDRAYERAREFFDRAISIDPDRAEFHFMMFYALGCLTRDSKAGIGSLLKAMELHPEWIYPRIQYVMCLIGDKEFKKAEEGLTVAYGILESRCNDEKIVGTNVLERYYLGPSGMPDYEYEKKELDSLTKELEKKRAENGASEMPLGDIFGGHDSVVKGKIVEGQLKFETAYIPRIKE